MLFGECQPKIACSRQMAVPLALYLRDDRGLKSNRYMTLFATGLSHQKTASALRVHSEWLQLGQTHDDETVVRYKFDGWTRLYRPAIQWLVLVYGHIRHTSIRLPSSNTDQLVTHINSLLQRVSNTSRC